MRAPAPDLYDWHDSTLRGERPAVFEDHPECGWFRMRVVKGGPWVAVRIWLDREVIDGELTGPEIMRAEIAGEEKPVRFAWPRAAGKAITETAYRELLVRKDDETMRATNIAVDLSAAPVRP